MKLNKYILIVIITLIIFSLGCIETKNYEDIEYLCEPNLSIDSNNNCNLFYWDENQQLLGYAKLNGKTGKYIIEPYELQNSNYNYVIDNNNMIHIIYLKKDMSNKKFYYKKIDFNDNILVSDKVIDINCSQFSLEYYTYDFLIDLNNNIFLFIFDFGENFLL